MAATVIILAHSWDGLELLLWLQIAGRDDCRCTFATTCFVVGSFLGLMEGRACIMCVLGCGGEAGDGLSFRQVPDCGGEWRLCVHPRRLPAAVRGHVDR